jgi:hypothetical protein
MDARTTAERLALSAGGRGPPVNVRVAPMFSESHAWQRTLIRGVLPGGGAH